MDAMTDRISSRLWPAGLTRVPYWVYTEPDVLAAEQKRIFEGPVWNYPLPGNRPPQSWRLPHHLRRQHARRGDARRGRRILCVREPLRASRRADLPGGRRQRAGLPVRLSRLALRPARQPALGRVQPRRQRQRRHAARFRHVLPRPAQAARRHVLRPGVRHAVARRARVRNLARPGDRRVACAAYSAIAGRRSSAGLPRRCRTTGSSMPRT